MEKLLKQLQTFGTQHPVEQVDPHLRVQCVEHVQGQVDPANPTKGNISIEISPGKAKKLDEEPDELVPAAPEVIEPPKDNIKKYGRAFQR